MDIPSGSREIPSKMEVLMRISSVNGDLELPCLITNRRYYTHMDSVGEISP